MIADILIVIIVLGFVLLGVWRGAARTLLNFAAVTVSAVIARLVSAALAEAVYNRFFRETVTNNVARMISESGEQYAAEHSMQALPGGVKRLIGTAAGMFGVSPDDLQGRLVSSVAQPQQVARAIERPLGELTVCILGVVLMMLLFAVLTLAFKPLVRLASGVFEIPVVSGVNRLLGGVLGALEGAVVVFVSANLMYILVSCTNPVLSENTSMFGAVFRALIILD